MADHDREFRHDSLQDRESIVNYLMALVEGFRKGRIHLGAGDEELVLEPEGLINLDVRARRKSRQMKLTVRVSWKDDPRVKTSRLVIRPEEGRSGTLGDDGHGDGDDAGDSGDSDD